MAPVVVVVAAAREEAKCGDEGKGVPGWTTGVVARPMCPLYPLRPSGLPLPAHPRRTPGVVAWHSKVLAGWRRYYSAHVAVRDKVHGFLLSR